jgi:hypothetical protein
VEATLDTAHVGTLHQAYIERNRGDESKTITHALEALAPRYEVERTSYGIDAAALRPMADGTTYLRTTKYIMPFISLVPGSAAADIPGNMFISSPIDDTHHNLFFGNWFELSEIGGPGAPVPAQQEFGVGTLPYDPHNYGRFIAGRDDNWGQDREAMKNGHFSGFTGNLLQEDIVTQASMGPIADRTKEHLSTSDVAIIHARRLLLDAIDDMNAGRRPPGAEPGVDHRDVVPVDVLLPVAN